MTEPRGRQIVVIGGGIIGCTTAYYMTQHPSYGPRDQITLLEASKLAGGASGKAGGLVALWAYPKCLVPLSFRLHAELAQKHNGSERWGYRRIHCGNLTARGRPAAAKSSEENEGRNHVSDFPPTSGKGARRTSRAAGLPDDLDWVHRGDVLSYEPIGDPHTTAQVHPYQFTTSMAQLAEAKGVKIILGRATKINEDSNHAVQSVSYRDPQADVETTIPASTVVLAAGPWTCSIYPEAPISALRAHSVTIEPSRPVSAYALFTDITLPTEPPTSHSARRPPRKLSPEIYARPNNEVYACGEADTLISLPASSSLVEVDETRCQAIIDAISSLSNELHHGTITAKQACYLPHVTTSENGPLIGPAPTTHGLFLAAGHTCWGIQNAPATAKLVAEMVFDGTASSADISELDPRRRVVSTLV